MKKETAKQIISLMLDCSRKLDDAVLLLSDPAEEEDAIRLRRAAGKIMGHIFVDLLDPVYRQYPDLEPEELRSQRSSRS